MKPGLPSQRRAAQFHDSVEHGTTYADARFADLLQVVGALRTQAPVQPRPAFVADLREQLLIEAAVALKPTTSDADIARLTLKPHTSKRERRLAVLVGGFAMASASTTMAIASQGALPGDTLYPIKRAIENVETGVQFGQADKGSTMLDNASGRLSEIDALSRDGDDAETINQTLQTFTDQAREGSDLILADYDETGSEASVTSLQEFTTASLDRLAELAPLVPDSARAALIEAAQTLTQIEREALVICPECATTELSKAPLFATSSVAELLDTMTAPVVAATPQPIAPKTPTKSATPKREANPGPSPEATPPAAGTPPVIDPPEIKTVDPKLPKSPVGNLGGKVKDTTDQVGGALD